MKFFTADTHFNHKNVLKYCDRPWNTVEEMNEGLIGNWNETVGVGDVTYILGDFAFHGSEHFLRRLNGVKVLVTGSHDGDAKRATVKKLYAKVTPLEVLKEKGYPPITLCHYCMRTWDKSHFNSWMLYGHSHGRLKDVGKSYDVGVDCNNFRPVTLGTVCSIMDSKPDNFNYINRRRLPSWLFKLKCMVLNSVLDLTDSI